MGVSLRSSELTLLIIFLEKLSGLLARTEAHALIVEYASLVEADEHAPEDVASNSEADTTDAIRSNVRHVSLAAIERSSL
jgi:hypothetical protein